MTREVAGVAPQTLRPAAVPAEAAPGRRQALAGASLPGAALGLLSLCLALTPSLLPRTWMQQGIIAGLSATVGYATGAAAGRLGRGLVPARQRAWLRRLGWRLVGWAAVPLVAVAVYLGSGWQHDLYRLMGARPPARLGYLGVLLLSTGILAGLVAVGRGLRAACRYLARLLRRWLPPRVAQGVALLAVALVVAGAVDQVVYDGGVRVVTAMARSVDRKTVSGLRPPASPDRSGSARSLVPWASLGREGRSFVAGGPSPASLARFNGAAAKQPIRVYVGSASAPSLGAQAALAVRELARTGGFARKVLCVVTTTGTGWIDPKVAAALEYMYNGDTALVGIQYSYLPSWVSFLSEPDRSAVATTALFDQVHARWSALPPAGRPRLLVFAESLGSLGAERAFGDLASVRARTDGMLIVGPTNANPIWRQLTAHRDPGTPEILPTYGQGRAVRFAGQPADLSRPAGPWTPPRIVYLEHASDPIVWWSPRLLVHRPDWLREPRGPDVLAAMHWYPFVTFFQVTTDLDAAYAAPPAHGHRYWGSIPAGWAALAAPPGWTAARTAALAALIAPRG